VPYSPIETFLQEAEELLSGIEQAALLLGNGEPAEGTIDELFRAFHTIKGSGAMCGLESVSGFTHHVEGLLERVRGGAVAASPALGELMLKARDHIKILLQAEQGGGAPLPGSSEKLIADVAQFANPAPQEAWLIRFHPNPALLRLGGNPIALFRELAELGPCEVTAHTDSVPALDAFRPDQCYLWWTITLRGVCNRNAVQDVFLFVEDDSELEIERIESAPTKAPAKDPPNRTSGSTPVVDGAVPTSGNPPISAAAPQRSALPKESTVRVPSDRLDRLVNLVGELVMNQSRLAQVASQAGAAEFVNPVQELERLVAQLREDVLGIRMLPIGTLFGRFRRLVHDLSTELGKEVDLITEGSETELDKSILDQLGEPMVHLLRNSVDHGIEPARERVAQGKPRRGTVRLSAVHAGSDVVVHIADDGRGMNRAAIRARATEKQLIPAGADLTDKEILNLILLPGFSTARKVTNVSGRGVGMDVVKRQIDALRGSLTLSTEEGRGSKLSIALPLTLAIIDGLLVQVGCDRFVIPMAAISENMELLRAERERQNGRNLVAVRGEPVPYIDLRTTFGIEGAAPQIEKIVIVRHEGQSVGLVVDRVLGTHQTVIQSLGRFLRNIHVVSGATIMGDGCVALILDIAAVVRFAGSECRET